MTLLAATGLTVELHSARLIDAVSLTLNAGEVLAVIGPNGAGKTSLVRALTGDLPLAKGEILFNGQPLPDYDLNHRARQLAMLSQQTTLNFPFQVADVVLLGRIPHASGRQQDNYIVAEALAAVDMSDRSQRLYTWLSGGEKQRVQLARVMAQVWRAEDAPARLLILDEPTASLDVAHTRQLMRGVRQMAASGVGVIMIVHDFNIAARYADRMLVLKDGILEAQGTPREVMTETTMQRIFNVTTRVLLHPDSGRPMVFIDD